MLTTKQATGMFKRNQINQGKRIKTIHSSASFPNEANFKTSYQLLSCRDIHKRDNCLYTINQNVRAHSKETIQTM